MSIKNMELSEKLKILAASAKYDVSCSSSGSTRSNMAGGIGNAAKSGICHSWADDGRCISLLKILMNNNCLYDCAFCVNRSSNPIPRASLTPEEVADITINFYKRNYIEGLFLSSGVFRSPDYTMEMMIRAVKLLRIQHRFNGYIHMKAIPGADPKLISEAGFLADRMSANIELPSRKSLALLAPEKNKDKIFSSIGMIRKGIIENVPAKRFKSPKFVPAGQSTQLIIGASPETDLSIVNLSEALYLRAGLKRVYYSAYIPVREESSILPVTPPQLRRENRLYQADWLLRFYNYSASEILDDKHPFLDLEIDPKSAWAVRNYYFFPVEVNRADYESLLRVPGIGVLSARKIIQARRAGSLTPEILKKIGVVMKRAKYFITCSGRPAAQIIDQPERIRLILADSSPRKDASQLLLFPEQALLPDSESYASAITGNI